MQYSTFEIRLDNSHKGLFALTIIPEFKQEFKRALDPELRIDNSGWGVNSSALFDVAGKRWYQSKYHVLYTIR